MITEMYSTRTLRSLGIHNSVRYCHDSIADEWGCLSCLQSSTHTATRWLLPCNAWIQPMHGSSQYTRNTITTHLKTSLPVHFDMNTPVHLLPNDITASSVCTRILQHTHIQNASLLSRPRVMHLLEALLHFWQIQNPKIIAGLPLQGSSRQVLDL